MSKPLDRDAVLAGYTYKLKWPESDHAIYVTINDIEASGRRSAHSRFSSARATSSYAWTVALAAHDQHRIPAAATYRLSPRLKAVSDPRAGAGWAGAMFPSLLAAIGEVIETRTRRIGFITDPDAIEELRSRLLSRHRHTARTAPNSPAHSQTRSPSARPQLSALRRPGVREEVAAGPAAPALLPLRLTGAEQEDDGSMATTGARFGDHS